MRRYERSGPAPSEGGGTVGGGTAGGEWGALGLGGAARAERRRSSTTGQDKEQRYGAV